MNPVGMIGRCPTVDIVMNGRKVRGLIDTGSEVTTVTERWVAENQQNSDLLPMTQVTLKAANGLECPCRGSVPFPPVSLQRQVVCLTVAAGVHVFSSGESL